MTKSEIIAGLDIGSGRVTCLIGAPEPDSERMLILGGASLACSGLSGGVVVSIPETKSAIEHVVEAAEAAAGVTVNSLFLGVRGAHLKSFNNHGAFNIARTDREITPDDVQGVIANATAIPISNDREILHVVPQSFSLDGQRGVPNPVGMEGSLLEVDVHIVTVASAHINNIMKAVTQAGFEVVDIIYGLLATGEQLVTSEEKKLGALLVDLGGQTVSIGVYSKGSIRYSKEIPIGADFITNDLAVGLHTSETTAERLKIAHGVAHASVRGEDEDIEFARLDGRTMDKAKTSTMMNYILPRVEDIFNIIGEDLQNSTSEDLVSPGGLILTGGGSLMKGMAAAAEDMLDLQTRLGLAHPDLVSGDEKWFSPVYATAMGLMTFAHSSRWGTGVSRLAPRRRPPWLRRLIAWFEGLI